MAGQQAYASERAVVRSRTSSGYVLRREAALSVASMTNQQVVLVTGAASGIGRASAERLLREGHIVYGGDINFDAMADLEERGMVRLRWDVTKEQDALDAAERAHRECGRIDALLANAGYTSFGMIELIDLDEARRQFDVNVIGMAAAAKAVLPYMRDAGTNGRGRIVFMSSAAGKMAPPGYGWYPATKHATEALADVLRREMFATFPGIKVSVIEPGYTNTNLIAGSEETWAKAMNHPHAGVYRRVMTNFMTNYKRGFSQGADVSSIANLVVKAMTDDKPKKRYRCHKDAMAAVVMARVFGDAAFVDKAVAQSMLGEPKPAALSTRRPTLAKNGPAPSEDEARWDVIALPESTTSADPRR